MIGCLMHYVPYLMGFGPCDCCFVMCCWTPNPANFKRSTKNDGGGGPIPAGQAIYVQADNADVPFSQARPAQQPAVAQVQMVQAQAMPVAQVAVAQPVAVVQAQPAVAVAVAVPA